MNLGIRLPNPIPEFWKRGNLAYKLWPHQKTILDSLNASNALRTVLLCSRRTGKTSVLLVDAWQECLKRPGIQIPFMLPYGNEIHTIVQPIVQWIQADAPVQYRAEWNGQRGSYTFANGSALYVTGTEHKQYESRRGINIPVKAYIDEAGSCADLQYMLEDILIPATMTGGGRIVISGTPPRTPSHAFAGIVERARADGSLIVRTIDDNEMVTPEVRARYIAEGGGRRSTTVRRELYCEFVTDAEHAVLPEFDDDAIAEIVVDNPRPAHYQVVAALDPGFSDASGYLIGYYDFAKGRIVVDGELMLLRQTTDKLAQGIKDLERTLYGTHEIHARYSDTALQVIADLNRLYKINIVPTAKDNLDAQINAVRLAIQRREIVINPRCRELVRQMRVAVWNSQRTDWQRDSSGHLDLLAALIYLVRNIDRSYNPYPIGEPGYGYAGQDERMQEKKDLAEVFGIGGDNGYN